MPDLRWPPPPERNPRRANGWRAPRRAGRRPPPPPPATSLVATPHLVQLEQLVTGAGDPVTVFGHGLAHGIPHTRPLGSAVRGRKVFFQFRGHGQSDSPPGPWGYRDLARDLRAIADLSAATRAVGISLGAGALCRLLAESPDRFERLVFYLPAALDERPPDAARERLAAVLAAAQAQDINRVSEAIYAELPPAARGSRQAWSYLTSRLDQLLHEPLASGYAHLPHQVPVPDLAALRWVSAPALVIGCVADPMHPPSVARRLADALPAATLHVYEQPGAFWTHRADLRERVSAFLNGDG
jgi:pimeloyl-ACP methyl ester carboxylesterase